MRSRVGLLGILLSALSLGLCFSTGVEAAQGEFEITPAFSYHFGADFDLEDPEFGRVNIDIADSDGLALFVDIPVNRSLQIELLAIRQGTDVAIDEGLFQEDFVIGNLDLDYYHVGALIQFAAGQVQPYFAISGGVTRFDFDIPGVADDTFPSLGLGGGVKVRFTDHLGLRFDGRVFLTGLDDGTSYDDRYCRRNNCDQNTVAQGFVAAGLMFSF